MKLKTVGFLLIALAFASVTISEPGNAQTKPFEPQEAGLLDGPEPAFEIVGDATIVKGPWHEHLMTVFVAPEAFSIENVKNVSLRLSKENPGEDFFQVYAFSDERERDCITRWFAAIQGIPFGKLPLSVLCDAPVNRPRLGTLYYRNDRGEAFLYYLANGDSITVELKSEDDPCSPFGDSAMDLVRASRFCEDVVRMLLDRGADPNLKSRYGGSPIVEASLLGQTEIVELLLERAAYINQTSSSGWTALIAAISNRHSTTIDLLLNRGADVNVRTEDGRTALMQAVQETLTDLAKKLLARGADPNVTDGYGQTALTIAEQTHNEELIGLLREFETRR